MFGLWEILVGAGAAILAGVVFAFKLISVGKNSARADSIIEAERQEDLHDSRIQDAHRAGDAVKRSSGGVQRIPTDPYDRANR